MKRTRSIARCLNGVVRIMITSTRDVKRGQRENFETLSAGQTKFKGGNQAFSRASVPQEDDRSCEDDPKTLKLLLDLMMKEVEEDPSKLVPYTEEMRARSKALVAGVIIDDV